MKLAQLTSEQLILKDVVFEDRLEAINVLVDKLELSGKLTDKQMFIDAVLKREEEGPTCLGEYLAVPHGKSEAVIEPVFACAFVKEELTWQGLDGDEPVNMIFLLAIPPAQAGSTHMTLLTTLTSSLVDDDFRESLLNAADTKEIMRLFGADEPEESSEPTEQQVVHQEDEMAQDISRVAYPVVLGAGLLVSAFLFMLL
ncbi:fructose PTS transporter subunit IIA [Vibrio hannami]|uniref:fructose PTS transporter subunit IIA n=1 Tax=Vibrio hannami TaxID=2717094 RepID=UPI00240F172C|nr:fructose PTS transporter subunit IIA [Vibrio hannami]MDG3086163.1 fructose PTS transporter subunit IIA [Vibrio hannami]